MEGLIGYSNESRESINNIVKQNQGFQNMSKSCFQISEKDYKHEKGETHPISAVCLSTPHVKVMHIPIKLYNKMVTHIHKVMKDY